VQADAAAVVQQQRRSRQGGRDARRLIGNREDCESSVDNPQPLGPHQQQEMRQRVLEAAKTSWEEEYDNVLECEEGVDQETVRSVFFAELRSVLTTSSARH
jgi:hypothetical protein